MREWLRIGAYGFITLALAGTLLAQVTGMGRVDIDYWPMLVDGEQKGRVFFAPELTVQLIGEWECEVLEEPAVIAESMPPITQVCQPVEVED